MTTASSTMLTTPSLGRRISEVRAAGMAGLLSVAAMIGSFAVLPPDPGGVTPEAVAARYADGAAGYLGATFLQSLSIGLFCVFAAGLCVALWTRRPGTVMPVAAALGGMLTATCQLLGYGLIAALAHGTADSGDLGLVMALYDLSAAIFVVANIGLAVLSAAAGWSLLRGPEPSRLMGWVSIVVAATATGAAGAHAHDGVASIHGDLGFFTFLIQLLWTAAMSVRLMRRTTGAQ